MDTEKLVDVLGVLILWFVSFAFVANVAFFSGRAIGFEHGKKSMENEVKVVNAVELFRQKPLSVEDRINGLSRITPGPPAYLLVRSGE